MIDIYEWIRITVKRYPREHCFLRAAWNDCSAD